MKTEKRLHLAMLAICLSVGLTGCLHPRIKVLDPNTDPVRLVRGTNYLVPVDGYFVPDATMERILDQLSEKDVFGK